MRTHVAHSESPSTGSRVDLTLEALTNERRRTVVQLLHGEDESVTVQELAADVARVEQVPPDRVEEVVIELHHKALPKLEQFGFLSYDEIEKRVYPEPVPDDVVSLLDYVGYINDR